MKWLSGAWARWLGWTALYAVLLSVGVLGLFVIEALPEPLATIRAWLLHLPFWGGLAALVFVPALPAFVIGVRFRSWSWGLGPFVVCILPIVVLSIWSGFAHGWGPQPGGIPGLGFALFLLSAMIGGVSALAALAGVWLGVWWEER